MTFGEMKLELRARMENLNDVRAGRFINDAYQELCDCYPWPFLKDAATGASPLSINNVRKVLSVVQNNTSLAWYEYDALVHSDPEMSNTGPAWAFYLTQTDTTDPMVTVVTAYPSNTSDLTVTYIERPTELSLDANVPTIPFPYHGLIVDMAQLRACRRHQESQSMIPYLQQSTSHELNKMVQALLIPTNQSEVVLPTGYYFDY